MIVIVKGPALIKKKGSTIVVKNLLSDKKASSLIEVPIIDLELLVIVGGNVTISSGTILMLSSIGVPIAVHGREVDSAILPPYNIRIAEVRRKLYSLVDKNFEWRTLISSAFIQGKIEGIINVARYFAYKDNEAGKEHGKMILEKVKNLKKEFREDLKNIGSLQDVRLLEAEYSRRLWDVIKYLIPCEYSFSGRNYKANDPINSAINYAYSILYSLSTHALIATGLDPYIGIMHVERAGRTALTYDFSEMFKPIAIHAVIHSARKTELKIDVKGYLKRKSLEIVTRTLYKLLKAKTANRLDNRGMIYHLAWKFRENIEKGTKFTPYIYNPKIR